MFSCVCVFQEMSEAGVEPDMVTYNTVINALARCGRVQEATDHVRAMKDQGLSPDVVTFGTLIHACAQSSRREAALALFAELVRATRDGWGRRGRRGRRGVSFLPYRFFFFQMVFFS